jgi:hypothetical protein
VLQIDSQIFSGIGMDPAAILSSAVLAERSPGIRIAGPEALTAKITNAAFVSKSSTKPSGRIAIKVWPQLFGFF